MNPAALAKPVDATRCAAITRAARHCRLAGTTAVPGVEWPLCRVHARIVATEPGRAGVVRDLPTTTAAILAELKAATTLADIERCRSAIARHHEAAFVGGRLHPDIWQALDAAKARIRNGGLL